MIGSVNVPGVSYEELSTVENTAKEAKETVDKFVEENSEGSALPACTEADNGKILRVVGGKAAWASLGNAEGIEV